MGSASRVSIRYASIWARLLDWLVFLPPFEWIGAMQSRISQAVLMQALEEHGAQPISVSLIVRGPQQNSLPLATPSTPDGWK